MKFFPLLIVLCSFTATSQDLSAYQKREFNSPEGGKLLYQILLPEQYDPGEKYPLILFLHGSGERGNDNEKQLTHGSQLFLDSVNRKNFPAIVVFPQCPQEDYWSAVRIDRTKSPRQLDFDYTEPPTKALSLTMGLVHDLISTEAVDKRRVYITGLSMGGMGTFEAVHRYPDIFAAALPICGGGDSLRYQKVKTAFWIFHGDADATVNVHYSRAMVERLKGLKVKVKYTEYPGVGHNSWNAAFAEPDFLKWMFEKRLRN